MQPYDGNLAASLMNCLLVPCTIDRSSVGYYFKNAWRGGLNDA